MSSNQEKKTSISTLGEFGLIDHLTKDIKLIHKSTVKGVGDDAAVLRYPEDEVVVTTDLLLEGVHFNLIYTPLQHLGYKSVVVNLSDVCAMNAIPQQITVSLGISSRFSLEDIELLVSDEGGRAPYYLIFEDSKMVEVWENPMRSGGGGAGWGVVAVLAEKGVKKVVVGKIGNNMQEALLKNNIEFLEKSGVSVQEILQEIVK